MPPPAHGGQYRDPTAVTQAQWELIAGANSAHLWDELIQSKKRSAAAAAAAGAVSAGNGGIGVGVGGGVGGVGGGGGAGAAQDNEDATNR